MGRVSKSELSRTITGIMKNANLDQLTTKKIRIICEQKYGTNLMARKQEIDDIVMSFINKHCKVEKKKNDEAASSSSYDSDDSSCTSQSSCSESECCYSSDGEAKTQPKPAASKAAQAPKVAMSPAKKSTSVPVKKSVAPKKPKVINTQDQNVMVSPTPKSKDSPAKRAVSEMDDAAYARQLQAEEWNFRKRTVKKLFRNIPQKKNDKNEQAKRRKATPFLKKCLLSPALAEVLGTNEMSRPDIVQKMWSVVRERNLFDASNKQYAICDEQLFKIFGKKRIRVIGMMKYLKNHIKDIR